VGSKGIWQILLDFSGGLLSDLQLVGDCWSLGDWSGISGNFAKLLLGFVSIAFDTIFMLQHYVWYTNEADDDEAMMARGIGEFALDNEVGLLL
jgi:cystinosin